MINILIFCLIALVTLGLALTFLVIEFKSSFIKIIIALLICIGLEGLSLSLDYKLSCNRFEELNDILKSQNIENYLYVKDGLFIKPGSVVTIKYNFRDNFSCYKSFTYTTDFGWVDITDTMVIKNNIINKLK